MEKGGRTILRRVLKPAIGLAVAVALVASFAPPAGAASIAQMSADVDRAVAGSLGEDAEQALFGNLADVSVQVADAYDQWVRTGSEESRRAALGLGNSILPLLERLRAHHQGRIDKAQAEIIRQDGNPETLYTQKWWQLDRGFTLAAAGQLSWLHYRMAMLSPGEKEKRRQWLEKATKEFSEFLASSDQKVRLESLLGRGMSEGELGQTAEAAADLEMVLQEAKGTSLYWPARMALAQVRVAGGGAALSETQRLLAEAQSAGISAELLKQIRMLRFDALLNAMAAGGAGEGVRSEAASLAAQLSSLGPSYSQRVSQMTIARLKDPRPVLGQTVSAEWIAAENLAAAEKFDEAAKAYERIARSSDTTHATEVHQRLGVCYFRLKRYGDAERELRTYLSKAPKGALATEAAYLQFRAAEGVFRASPTPETRASFLAVAENFVGKYPEHESRYEAAFRIGELLQDERRYMEAADAYAKVDGPPAFRMRAAAAELQTIADVITTSEKLDAAKAKELHDRAEAAWVRFDKIVSAPGANASSDLRARTTVARAMAAGSGPGADPKLALSLLDGFEQKYPDVRDLVLPTTAIRVAAATSLNLVDQAEPALRILAASPGTEANYFDIVEKLAHALLRRSADEAPTDPSASQRWAAMATTLLDKMRAAGRPIPDEVRLNLAQSYVEQNRLNDAAAMYEQLLAATPDSRSLLRASALLADKRGRADEAAVHWAKLAQLQEVATPAWYEARLATASALAGAGQKDKACANVTEVEAFRPDLRDAATKQRFAEISAQVCSGAAN